MDETQVGRLLLEELDDLSMRVVAMVWRRVPGYEPPRIRRDELAAAVRPNVSSVLTRLVDPDAARPGDRERARELGTARALQGVPLDVVVQSFRTAERVLADAFIARASGLQPDEMRRGLRRLAEGFDQLSTWAIEGYHHTQDELTSHYDRAAGDLVAGLVAGDIGDETVRRQAAALGSDPDATYQVVALRTAPGDGISRSAARLQREVLGVLAEGLTGRIIVGSARSATLFLIPRLVPAEQRTALQGLLGVHRSLAPAIGVGPAGEDLYDAGRSCRRALAALDAAHPEQLVDYDDVLLDVLLGEAADVRSRLLERFAGSLVGAEHLGRTVQAYLANDMSIRDTAAALHLHPNTVAYRLDRIREVTGRDPRRPRELFLLDLTVRALAAA